MAMIVAKIIVSTPASRLREGGKGGRWCDDGVKKEVLMVVCCNDEERGLVVERVDSRF